MVIVRLSRAGSKKHAFYHVVVADKQRSRDGRFIERLGTYDPKKPPADARINRERLDYWLSVGAQPSHTVGKVIREHAKAMEAVAARPA